MSDWECVSALRVVVESTVWIFPLRADIDKLPIVECLHRKGSNGKHVSRREHVLFKLACF